MTPSNLIISKQFFAAERPYYCISCKTHLFDINGDTLVLWNGPNFPPSEIPLNMFWVKHRCRGCKKDYNIYFQV